MRKNQNKREGIRIAHVARMLRITHHRFYPAALGLCTAVLLLGAEFLVAARPDFFSRLAWIVPIPFAVLALLAAHQSRAWMRALPLALLPYSAWHLHVLLPDGAIRTVSDALLAIFAASAVGFEARAKAGRIAADLQGLTRAALLFTGIAALYGFLGFMGGKAWHAFIVAAVAVPFIEVASRRSRVSVQEALFAALLSVELFWVLLLFPFGYLTKGLLFAVLFTGGIHVAEAMREGPRARASRLALAFAVLTAVVMAAARWG